MLKRNRQRIAISKAHIAKQSNLWGSIAQGFRAFREGLRRGENPHHDINQSNAWFQGWNMAQEQQQEKEND